MFFQDVFTPCGSMCLNNSGGIEIEISSCGDDVRYRYHWGEPPTDEPKEAEILYLPNDDLQGSEEAEGEELFACFQVGEGENQSTYFLAEFIAYR